MAEESINKPEAEEEEDNPLGKYGIMREVYLMEHRLLEYKYLLESGKLQSHLRDVDDTAHERLEHMMAEMLKRDPAPDKATNPMGWVGHMNSLQASAEEVILAELVYN